MTTYHLIAVFHDHTSALRVIDAESEEQARRQLVGEFMACGMPLHAVRLAEVRR